MTLLTYSHHQMVDPCLLSALPVSVFPQLYPRTRLHARYLISFLSSVLFLTLFFRSDRFTELLGHLFLFLIQPFSKGSHLFCTINHTQQACVRSHLFTVLTVCAIPLLSFFSLRLPPPPPFSPSPLSLIIDLYLCGQRVH